MSCLLQYNICNEEGKMKDKSIIFMLLSTFVVSPFSISQASQLSVKETLMTNEMFASCGTEISLSRRRPFLSSPRSYRNSPVQDEVPVTTKTTSEGPIEGVQEVIESVDNVQTNNTESSEEKIEIRQGRGWGGSRGRWSGRGGVSQGRWSGRGATTQGRWSGRGSGGGGRWTGRGSSNQGRWSGRRVSNRMGGKGSMGRWWGRNLFDSDEISKNYLIFDQNNVVWCNKEKCELIKSGCI